MLALPALFLSLGALIQDPAAPAQEAQEAPLSSEQLLAILEKQGLKILHGPADADLGAEAHVAVPEGSVFLDGPSTRRWLEMNENLANGQELGAIWRMGPTLQEGWWAYFEFSKDGYVKDDDKEIDADALMKDMKEGNAASNEERKKRGWTEVHLVGWHKPPFYDPATHNLTWSKLIEAEERQSVNWSTRLLGRGGVMNVDLVLGPERVEAALPDFAKLLGGFEFRSGHKYAEFKAGDKVAEYGLAGLIGVGAGALALKTGLFAKLWKLLIIPIAAVGAWLKKLFSGSKKPNEDAAGPSA
jgi:uncharacterized membrane-anchored protein